MRALTHVYCIRKMPLQKIDFIYNLLGDIIRERCENPKTEEDKSYAHYKKFREGRNDHK